MRDYGKDFVEIFNKIECIVIIEATVRGLKTVGFISDFMTGDKSNTKLYLIKCLNKYIKTEKNNVKVVVAKSLKKEIQLIDESDCVCLSGDITMQMLNAAL